ncbi:helix-turn-helix domain-containing protein [Enterococcus sp. RIT-PI-f]|uniref:helix-turn-helix domain-containing protein n=1 Tax=Enterococcus sp. RIT-PI-f TaxID=1690244 RepID=UPI0006B97144|nr:helix-turn-helix domain-containing protein [Enterococcus sp. RIT-PI-f]KPG71748.1 hypothetical protein AEQ18_03675 [Enterococcus sp. RIT-PI-f]
MWIDLFLEKREVRKLALYQSIISLRSVELQQLKERTHFSESTIPPMIQEIEQDFYLMHGFSFSLSDSFRKENQTTLPDFHHYRQYLLEHSLVAHAFYAMLLTPESGIKTFCERQFLSRATVFRKLSVVKEILAPFHLQFNVNKLELIGSEVAIRYFFCNIFWFLKPHIIEEYPLSDGDLTEFIEDLCGTFDAVTTVGNKQKFELCLKIGQLRREAGFYITEEIDQHKIVLSNSFRVDHQDSFYTYLKKTCPSTFLANEANSFYFILYSGAIFVHQHTSVYQMFKEWTTHKNVTYQVIRTLTDQFSATFLHGQQPDEYPIITANLTSVLNACEVLNDAPPLIFLLLHSNWQIKEPLSKEVFKYIYTYLKRLSRRKKYAFLADHLTSLSNLFTYFLWPSVKAAIYQQPLSVAVIAEDNFITMQPLYHFFTEHPYVALSPYEEQTNIDLLIIPHHSFHPLQVDAEVFHYNYLAVENQFADLKQALAQQQLQKYENRLMQQAAMR